MLNVCLLQMDEHVPEEDGQTVPVHKEEEEMDVTVTSQLENLIVTLADADASPSTETPPEEKADVDPNSTAVVLSSDAVCETKDCEDEDRYSHRRLVGYVVGLNILVPVQEKTAYLTSAFPLLSPVTALHLLPPLLHPHLLPLPVYLRMMTMRVSANQPPSKPEMKSCSRSV